MTISHLTHHLPTFHLCDLNRRRFLVTKVMEQDIAAIVEDIEAEQAKGRVSGVQVFRSMLNQPALLSVSSANATNTGSVDGYSFFNTNMPRPILQAKTLQLLDAVIPLPTANIPDTACGFWYYRLSVYSGLVPNQNNLYFSRLLPSYYKKELMINPSNYGFNQTFNSYSNVATQLALSTSNDIAATNQLLAYQDGDTSYSNYQIQYIPNDISLTYDTGTNKFQMTGQNVTLPFATSAWSSVYTYIAGAVIYHSNANTIPNIATYQSLQAANSNHNPYTTLGTWWKRVYTDIVQPWSNTINYRRGQLATSTQSGNLVIYEAMWDAHLNGAGSDFIQLWDAGRLYQLNDIVTGATYTWVCIQPNTAVNPESVAGPNYWIRYDWSSSYVYPINCRAYHSATNSVYASTIANNTNNTPSSTSPFWKRLGVSNPWTPYTLLQPLPQTGANYYYLSTGYNDPNVVLNQGTSKKLWNQYALYEANDKVLHNGVDYYAMEQNQNYQPFPIAGATIWTGTRTYAVGDIVYYTAISSGTQYFIATAVSTGQYPSGNSLFWSLQKWSTQNGAVAPTMGLYTISSRYDFMVISFGGGALFGFPYRIPGQPFNPSPRRLLNTILGFTWNGQFNPSVFYIDPTQIEVNIEAYNYFRRMRPIPLYIAYGGEEGYTPQEQAVTTPVYTAEGYANLVYTSIVSVYATIVGGSTLNTQRSTNLLAIVSMNAGNLGVGYYQHYLDDALKVYDSDIYNIGIELRDEMDEPYVLTNNAVCTFTMKLTYKE